MRKSTVVGDLDHGRVGSLNATRYRDEGASARRRASLLYIKSLDDRACGAVRRLNAAKAVSKVHGMVICTLQFTGRVT